MVSQLRARYEMFDDRVTARIVGALFVVATITAIVGGSLLVVVDDAGSLDELADDRVRVVSGVLVELALAVSVIGIAAVLRPVLGRVEAGLATGYVAIRTLEATVLASAALVALVAGILGDGGGAAASDDAVGDLLLAAREWSYLVGSTVLLGVGALVLYPVLHNGALVPGWLAVWGTVGGALIIVLGAAEMYGSDPPPLVRVVLTAPIALNEMVLAVRLVVWGFDESTDVTDVAAVGTR